MYQILCDNYVIHDPRSDELKVIDPVCDLALNKSGSLTFKISPNNPNYDTIKKLKSEISVYQDGVCLFCGRVLNDEIEYNNVKLIECEGELSYLLDSIQRNAEYHCVDDGDKNKVQVFLESLINIHNEQVEDKKKFIVGNVSIQDTSSQLYKYTTFNSTHECISDKLINTFGGYILTRNIGGTKYIDYIGNDNLNINSQIIKFGENIIDMTQYIKGEYIATAIIPRGTKTGNTDTSVDENENSDNGTIEERLDITSIADFEEGTIKHTAGTDYIYDTEAVEKYGWIYKVVEFDNVEEEQILFNKGKEQLEYYKKQSFNIELTAIDLHLLNVNIESIKLGDKIKVISLPHNLNTYMIVNSISIDMTRPENTVIELISEERYEPAQMNSDKSKDNSTKIEVAEKDISNIKDNYDFKFQDYDDKLTDYDNKFDEYDTKLANYDTNLGNTIDSQLNTKIPNAINDYLSNGGSIDLSGYATITDVNNAFNELATLLGGL